MSTPLDQVRNGLPLDGFGKPLDRPRSVGDPLTDTAISAAQVLSRVPASALGRGGYVLAEGRRPSRPPWCRDGGTPDVILLATGSAVHVALAAREQLHADGISTRVVSMPSRELFDRQSQQYRDDVLPPSVTARVAVERAPTLGWDRYVGTDDAVAGIHTFGALTHRKLLVEFGFTSDQVAQAARDRLAAVRRR